MGCTVVDSSTLMVAYLSPLRDMRTIAEKLAAEAAASQDLGVLAAGVRAALG